MHDFIDVFLDKAPPSAITLAVVLFGLWRLGYLKRKSNGNSKDSSKRTKYITKEDFAAYRAELTAIRQWTKDVSFTKTNEEGVKVTYIRGSTQKALEELCERFESILEEGAG